MAFGRCCTAAGDGFVAAGTGAPLGMGTMEGDLCMCCENSGLNFEAGDGV